MRIRTTLLTGVALLLLGVPYRAGAAPALLQANGHYYEVVIDEESTWTEARDDAAAAMHNGYRGHLATITSAEEDTFVSQAVQSEVGRILTRVVPPHFFLGGLQADGSIEPGLGWQWASKESFSYAPWLPGEPNNSGGRENVVVTWSADAEGRLQWNDADGSNPVSGYVVEYEPEPPRCRWVSRPLCRLGHVEPAVDGNNIVWVGGDGKVYLRDLTTGTETCISSSTATASEVAISGNSVVWTGYRNMISEIYAYDLTTKTETRIASGSGERRQPAISGDRIVWTDARNGNDDIYLYDLATKTEDRITSDAGDEYLPAISGGRIVWRDRRNGIVDIYLHDLATGVTTRITADGAIPDTPAIFGDKIVWPDYRNGNYDIYLYDLATGTESRITSGFATEQNPDISGGRIVWEDYRNGAADVYLYEMSSGTETRITVNPGAQTSPRISGDRIVWTDWRNADSDVYLFDLRTSTETRISYNRAPSPRSDVSGDTVVFEDRAGDIFAIDFKTFWTRRLGGAAVRTNPAVSGSRVVWEDYRNGAPDIYLYDLTSLAETRVTSDPGRQTYPRISGDRIVWMDDRNGNSDIYLYDIRTKSETRLTFDPSTHWLPVIWGDKIVWWDDRNGNNDIYLYDLASGRETRITSDSKSQILPSISDGRVVWTDYRSGIGNGDVYLYDLASQTETQIGASPDQEGAAAISGNRIVFERYRNGHFGLYLHDLATQSETCLTAGHEDFDHRFPAISGDRVVWRSVPYSIMWMAEQDCQYPPVANAGADQAVHPGWTAILSGSASSDPDNNYPLTYAWKLVSAPASSTARLFEPASEHPSLTPDVLGEFVVELVVTDSVGLSSVPDTATIRIVNARPVANAGPDQGGVPLNSPVTIDGSGSFDPDRDSLAYRWRLQSAPAGSNAAVSRAGDGSAATLTPDVMGVYEVVLVVNDGYEDSAPDSAFVLALAPSDLVVSALSGPATVIPGGSVTVSETTTNNGPEWAPTTVTKFYWSNDAILDALDVEIGRRTVPALAALGSDSGTTRVDVPAGACAGTFYIIAKADANGLVPETDEANNTSSQPATTGPDLVIPVLNGPAKAVAGQRITVAATTQNAGGCPAMPSTTRFYLSTNTALDALDRLLLSREVGPLLPGAASPASVILTIPSGIAGGVRYVIAKADAAGVVMETNEANNIRLFRIELGPDLNVFEMASPVRGGAGATVTVSDMTRNRGAGPAAASVTKYYLSRDRRLTPRDREIGRRDVPRLAAGAMEHGSAELLIPGGTPTGVHYIIAKADATDVVAEANETNNIAVKSISIGPDLVVTIAAPVRAARGTTIQISETTANTGGGSADVPFFTKLFLSRDAVLRLPADRQIYTREIAQLAARGSSIAPAKSWRVPVLMGTGTYYLIGVADPGNTVAETDETNNTTVRSITIR